jgi:tetratricopeptide (TPR) repeat protein
MGGCRLYAQQGNLYLRKGNNAYDKKDYKGAADYYEKALNSKPDKIKAKFNLGDALYRQGQYDEAIDAYKEALGLTKDEILNAHAYHNIGNSLLAQKKYDESIKAYKNALYNNCTDNDTRYNLAYAEEMKKKKEQQQNKQNQPQQQQQQPQQQQQQQAQPKEQISKEDAQRMLDALNNDEKKLQDNLQKKKATGKKQIEKDW